MKNDARAPLQKPAAARAEAGQSKKYPTTNARLTRATTAKAAMTTTGPRSSLGGTIVTPGLSDIAGTSQDRDKEAVTIAKFLRRLGDEGVDAQACRNRDDGEDKHESDEVAGAVARGRHHRQRRTAVWTYKELGLNEFAAVVAPVHQ